MSIESTLKKQSKAILAKNNWAKSIVGFLCVSTMFCLLYIIICIASLFMGEDFTTVTENPVNMALVFGISMIGLVVVILLSPIYTGYMKFIYECKNSKTGDIQNIFYYFAKGKYMDTIQLNLLLAVIHTLFLIICFAPGVVSLICAEIMPEYETVFQIVAVWLVIIGAIAYFLISRLYVMTQYLYVADFNYRKEKDLIKASLYMVKKNYSKIINLYISYILWSLMCYFVIPVVFVYPYFKHTAVLSYSYIYEMENNNPQSPYYRSNQQINNTEVFSGTNCIENTQDYNNNASAVDNNNFSANAPNFENNPQTSKNSFIPVENSDIIENYNG